MLKKPQKETGIRQRCYSNAEIKARSYLANIACPRLNKEAYNNRGFIRNLAGLLAHNMNLSSLERKFQSLHDRQIVQFMLEKCVLQNFYKFICQKDVFCTMIFLDSKLGKTTEIFWIIVQNNWTVSSTEGYEDIKNVVKRITLHSNGGTFLFSVRVS